MAEPKLATISAMVPAKERKQNRKEKEKQNWHRHEFGKDDGDKHEGLFRCLMRADSLLCEEKTAL